LGMNASLPPLIPPGIEDMDLEDQVVYS